MAELATRKRVLIIDDEPTILRSYKALFGRDHEIVTAEGGAAAFELLATDVDFDLLLCDLHMPGIDGIEIYEHLQQAAPALCQRVVFCTGGVVTTRAQQFLDDNRPEVLNKPIEPALIESTIGRYSANR